jgi:hypothetical protein
MKNHAGRLLSIALFLLLPGCSEPTIREGLWELSYVDLKIRHKGTSDREGKDLPLPPRHVNVRVEYGPNDTQMAEFDYVKPEGAPREEEESGESAEQEDPDFKPIFADIRRTIEGKPPTIHVEAKDSSWMWRMWGVIIAPEEIDGTHLSAIARSGNDVTIVGRWRMRWLAD